jgi:DNA polymerase delta subunit 1
MDIDDTHMDDLLKYFNSKLAQPGIESCEFHHKKSIMHYTEKKHRFIKVTATLPKYINSLRQQVEKGLSWSNDQFWNTTYESSVPHPLRFMIDNGIVGMSWITLNKGDY